MGRRKSDPRPQAFYFDESVHCDQGFILGAYVLCSPTIPSEVAKALRVAGLRPGIDEFKWGGAMKDKPHLQTLRESLLCLLGNTRIGIVVVNASERAQLGEHALQGLGKILRTNEFDSPRLRAFFDEGVFPSRTRAEKIARDIPELASTDLFFERDSRWDLGLQLADAAAGAASEMLAEKLRGVKKWIDIGDEEETSGYSPGTMAELGWTYWAGFRYAFFTRPIEPEEVKNLVPHWTRSDHVPFLNMQDVGVYLSPTLDPRISAAVLDRFGTVYIGCIH